MKKNNQYKKTKFTKEFGFKHKLGMQNFRGFSLMELMLTLIVMAMLASIALPNYTAYIQRKDLADAKQQALRIAAELQRFKVRNFSYQGFNLSHLYASRNFDPVKNQLYLPISQAPENAKYVLTLVDLEGKTALHQQPSTADHPNTRQAPSLNWAIKVERARTDGNQFIQPKNYDLLLTSTGVRCMTQVADQVAGFRDCGTEKSEQW